MSYRSFKRVLGETNLERKCRFLFGACLLLLISGSFYWYGRQTEKLVYRQNITVGRPVVDRELLRLHWVQNSNQHEFGFAGALSQMLTGADDPNLPKYETVFLRQNLAEPEALRAELSATLALPSDEFEQALMAYYTTGGLDIHDRRLPDEQKYQYYQPIFAKDQTCVECHRSTAEPFTGDVGDLMAVARVTVPEGPTQDRLHWNRAILASTAIITVVLAMIAAYAIVRYVIAKPLRHLKEVSDAVSHGQLDKRAEIRTGDEFEELGRAFNRMLRHLVAVQEELRQVNGDLDGKVDELAQANMALYEMNRLKSDFLATMSHELRTPLNSILGFSDVLATIDSLDDKQKRYVRNIQQSGKMLLDMINDILDLAKIESGKMELRLVDMRLEHVIGAQCDLARPLAEKKNIDLLTEIESGLPMMHQDQAKVQQVLGNLLSNAIKFTPEGGSIRVLASSPDGQHLEMVVADTGVGIADEDQEIIFEKFRQGSGLVTGGTMTREYSGTGLGLSIVKELCKLLGGTITLESKLGKGSTFTVRLPLVLPDQHYRSDPSTPIVDLAKARLVHFGRRHGPSGRQGEAAGAPK